MLLKLDGTNRRPRVRPSTGVDHVTAKDSALLCLVNGMSTSREYWPKHVPNEGVRQVARRLAYSAGITGGALIATWEFGTLTPVLMVMGLLTSLPMLLIISLAMVAVYSPHPARRATAERILSQLLSALTGAP